MVSAWQQIKVIDLAPMQQIWRLFHHSGILMVLTGISIGNQVILHAGMTNLGAEQLQCIEVFLWFYFNRIVLDGWRFRQELKSSTTICISTI